MEKRGEVLFTVTVETIEGDRYKIIPTNHTAKNLRETELWMRANFQVTAEEWAELKAKLVRVGKASIERSASKFTA